MAIGFVLLATLLRRSDVVAIDRADGYEPAPAAVSLAAVQSVEDAA